MDKRTWPKIFGFLGVVILLSLPLRGEAASPPRGYQARACGFDLNHNGVLSEPGDCDKLCHGANAPISIDLDGNGIMDRQIFVNSATGNDANTGTSSSPKRTIQAAMNSLGAPSVNQMQAVCFTGTFSETLTPTQSGAPGVYIRPKSGSEERDFEYAKYPMILSGWDLNGNGQYPPYDTNDVAVLDGSVNGNLAVAIANDTGGRDKLEIAHFSAKNYGNAGAPNCPPSASFMRVYSSYQSAPALIYVHDLELTDILAGCGGGSDVIVFSMWGSRPLSFWAVENVSVNRFGSFFSRGVGPCSPGPQDCSGSSVSAGPWRYKNLTLTALGASGGSSGTCGGFNNCGVYAFKYWAYLTGVEILDSVFDGNISAWTPAPNSHTGVFGAHQCSRGWTFRNNYIHNFGGAPIVMQAWSGDNTACESRPVGDIVIDRNLFDYTPSGPGPWQYVGFIQSGSTRGTLGTTIDNVTITNNIFRNTANIGTACQAGSSNPGAPCTVNTDCPGGACVYWGPIRFLAFAAGDDVDPNPGAVNISGNTFSGPIPNNTYYNYGIQIEAPGTFHQNNITFKDNIVDTPNGKMRVMYAPTNFAADNNIYTSGGNGYIWNAGSATNLAGWRSALGGCPGANNECAANQCTPIFKGASTGDLHLTSTDTCAQNAGVDISSITAYD